MNLGMLVSAFAWTRLFLLAEIVSSDLATGFERKKRNENGVLKDEMKGTGRRLKHRVLRTL